MITEENRNIIRALFEQGKKKKEIARILGVDPKSVRSILAGKADNACGRKDKIKLNTDLLKEVLHRSDGYVQRAHEILTEEHQVKIAYSTLTRLVRQNNLQRSEERRVGKECRCRW